MAKKIVAPLAVGDLVYVHNAIFQGQRPGHCEEMRTYQGKSFVIERFVDAGPFVGTVLFTADSIYARGCKGNWTWDVRCFRRLRKAKNVIAPKVAPVDYEGQVLAFRQKFAQAVDRQGVGLCSFAQLVNDNKESIHIQAACHASVGRYYDRYDPAKKFNELILNIKGHIKQFPDGQKEDYKKNVEYILNRSPWSLAFVPEPMDVRWELGVRCNVNLPTQVLKAAAISLREMNEFRHRLPLFTRLVKEGHSENTAKLLAACINPNDTDRYSYSEFSNAHQIWWADFVAEELFEFFKKGFPAESLTGKTYAQADGGAYIIAARQARRWEKQGDVTISQYIKERLFGKAAKIAAPVRFGADVAQYVTHAKVKELAAHLDTVLN